MRVLLAAAACTLAMLSTSPVSASEAQASPNDILSLPEVTPPLSDTALPDIVPAIIIDPVVSETIVLIWT